MMETKDTKVSCPHCGQTFCARLDDDLESTRALRKINVLLYIIVGAVAYLVWRSIG